MTITPVRGMLFLSEIDSSAQLFLLCLQGFVKLVFLPTWFWLSHILSFVGILIVAQGKTVAMWIPGTPSNLFRTISFLWYLCKTMMQRRLLHCKDTFRSSLDGVAWRLASSRTGLLSHASSRPPLSLIRYSPDNFDERPIFSLTFSISARGLQ